jgi:hypothetical protein
LTPTIEFLAPTIGVRVIGELVTGGGAAKVFYAKRRSDLYTKRAKPACRPKESRERERWGIVELLAAKN